MDLYIYGSCDVNSKIGAYAYSLEDQGRILYREAKARANTTAQAELLYALSSALNFIYSRKLKGDLRIYSNSQYILDAFNKGWIIDWSFSNWRNASGKEIKNYSLWKQVCDVYMSLCVEGTVSFLKIDNKNSSLKRLKKLADTYRRGYTNNGGSHSNNNKEFTTPTYLEELKKLRLHI